MLTLSGRATECAFKAHNYLLTVNHQPKRLTVTAFSRVYDYECVRERVSMCVYVCVYLCAWGGPRLIHFKEETTNKNGRRKPGHNDQCGGAEDGKGNQFYL